MIPCPAISSSPFTDGDPTQWFDGKMLGPVWLQSIGGMLVADALMAPGLSRFIRKIEEMATGFNLVLGTAYATMLDGEEVRAGRMHYDAGRRDSGARGEILRFTATWSSDGTNLNNAFLRRRDPRVEQEYLGQRLTRLPAEFVQPRDRYITLFSEGLDLHGRMPSPARPGQWGVLLSATLYRPDQEVDLFCPRYLELRDRIPDAVKVLGTQVREDYESA